LRAPSEEAAIELAERLRRAAAENDVALAFGIDLDDDPARPAGESPMTLGFACDRAREVLWPARKVIPSRKRGERPPTVAESRVVSLAGRRVGIVIGCEAFHVGVLRSVAAGSPELIVLMTHVGPTPRWRPALDRLARIAPVVVTGELNGALELPASGGGGGDDDDDPRRVRNGPPPLPFWAAAPTGWTRARVGCHAELELHAYSPVAAAA
jgi:hypothetical protein